MARSVAPRAARGRQTPPARTAPPTRTRAAEATVEPPAVERDGRRRVVVESLSPAVDAGAFPAKRALGERVAVEADVFTDGHDLVSARLLYRSIGEPEWRESPLQPMVNDRFAGGFVADRLGRWEFAVEGWIDAFGSWRRDLAKRDAAKQVTEADLEIGARLVRAAATRAANEPEGDADARALDGLARDIGRDAGCGELAGRVAVALDPRLQRLVDRHPDRSLATRHAALPLVVDPAQARFSSWYEMFPRSASPEPGRHGTFRDVAARLDYVAAMGFDVLYLPPIHPIGTTHRKGRNNAKAASPGDVGSPWAIGGAAGGHEAIEPALGTLDDFRHLVRGAEARGIRIALDLAFQCSPDHPWVREHPEWFRHRPDGTIQHAENPPKKYEDIVPFDFETRDWRALWAALAGVVEHWIAQGVTIFRVDNPHTKAFPFWEWMIGDVRARHPEVFFLAEAFTRPKVMYRLGKVGFSQSYNYFPWRMSKRELTEYLTEVTRPPVAEYFRANLWPNTPDILTEQLQHGGRATFVQRLVLAATLGASYGIYGPPFELMEATPREPGSEEYGDSEKYELRHWDLTTRESLAELIGRVNRIRRENAALHHDRGLAFHPIDNEALLCFSKVAPDANADADAIVVVVNLDPLHQHGGWLDLDYAKLGWAGGEGAKRRDAGAAVAAAPSAFQAHDLLTDARFVWHSGRNYVALDPHSVPAAIFRLRRRVRSEVDFDYFL
ncbi:MAG TPA: alpha-1,4-glucan--maltose-1-phosphate maltosyltransferase [Thermoanaerobaculia bacterium]|jgi:starch synthase (maltosyl-transferring)|nr:alpha-1,4-glucan--maltose-1-phosphate maltosyltransferase [Thermoanaerobaculia bacterium]